MNTEISTGPIGQFERNLVERYREKWLKNMKSKADFRIKPLLKKHTISNLIFIGGYDGMSDMEFVTEYVNEQYASGATLIVALDKSIDFLTRYSIKVHYLVFTSPNRIEGEYVRPYLDAMNSYPFRHSLGYIALETADVWLPVPSDRLRYVADNEVRRLLGMPPEESDVIEALPLMGATPQMMSIFIPQLEGNSTVTLFCSPFCVNSPERKNPNFKEGEYHSITDMDGHEYFTRPVYALTMQAMVRAFFNVPYDGKDNKTRWYWDDVKPWIKTLQQNKLCVGTDLHEMMRIKNEITKRN